MLEKGEVVKIGRQWYYVVSTHNSKANAKKRMAKIDFPSKLRKDGKRWAVLQKASGSLLRKAKII